MGRAVIIYNRPGSSPGQRAVIGGALLAAVIIPMWLASVGAFTRATEPSAPMVNASGARKPVVDPVPQLLPPPPLPIAAEAPSGSASAPSKSEAPAAPYRYAGHWRHGSRTTLVLSAPGYSTVVRVPGPVDDRFDVVQIDDRRVLLKDRPTQRLIALPLSGESAQLTVDTVKVERQGVQETPVTPPSPVRPETVASPPTAAEVPVVQFGGGRADAEPEN